MKRSTVYLEDEDLVLLKRKAIANRITVAEALRQSIRESCQPATKEEADLWAKLDKIWEKNSFLDPDKVEKAVNKVVKEVRSGKKKTRSHN